MKKIFLFQNKGRQRIGRKGNLKVEKNREGCEFVTQRWMQEKRS